MSHSNGILSKLKLNELSKIQIFRNDVPQNLSERMEWKYTNFFNIELIALPSAQPSLLNKTKRTGGKRFPHY